MKKILIGLCIIIAIVFMLNFISSDSSIGCTGKNSNRCEVYSTNWTCIKYYSEDVPICQENIQGELATPISGTSVIPTSGDSVLLERTSEKFIPEKVFCNSSTAENLSACNSTSKTSDKCCIACSPFGEIVNKTYCNGREFVNQRSWGNLCENDFECLEGFCFEERCYRGGKIAYLENKNKELENRLNELERQINSLKENNSLENQNLMTGASIDDFPKETNWIKNLFEKLFHTLFQKF